MKNIKTKWTEIRWLKIGYCNCEYFKDRKQICYKSKLILFQWNPSLFYAVCMSNPVSLSHIIDK